MTTPNPVSVRFWRHVERRGPDECWPWTGSPSQYGYGTFGLQPGECFVTYRRPLAPSRVAWMLTHMIDPGSDHIDHVCHNADPACPGGVVCMHRRCCNPAHLRRTTAAENKAAGKSANAVNARKTHCIRGHEFTEANTIRKNTGYRECRTCHYADDRRRYAARKAAYARDEE